MRARGESSGPNAAPRWATWVGRAVVVLPVVGVLVLVLMALAERVAEGREMKTTTVSGGEWVEAGGIRFEVLRVGWDRIPGRVPVVIELGLGETLQQVVPLVRRLGGVRPVLAYHRSGLGASSAGSSLGGVAGSRAEESVRNVELLLRRLQVQGPVIVVGSGYGSDLGRLLARRFPDRVAGLVAVGATWAGFESGAPLSVRTQFQDLLGTLQWSPLLARFGLLRLGDGRIPGFPTPLAGLERGPRHQRAVRMEIQGWAALRAGLGPAGQMESPSVQVNGTGLRSEETIEAVARVVDGMPGPRSEGVRIGRVKR